MLDSVRHRLADNEIGGRLDLFGKSLVSRVQVDRDGCAAGEVGERRCQPLVQPGRPHAGGDRAQVFDRQSDLVDRRVQCRAENPGLPRQRALQPSQHDPERHQPLLRAVVQIALEPPALLVAGPHHPGSRLLHLGKLQPYLHAESRNLDRQARRAENAAEQIGMEEQRALVTQQPDLLSPMLHLRSGALVAGRLEQHGPEAIGVGVACR